MNFNIMNRAGYLEKNFDMCTMDGNGISSEEIAEKIFYERTMKKSSREQRRRAAGDLSGDRLYKV